MSAVEVAHGSARVSLDGYQIDRHIGTGASISYAPDDLLRATVATLRAVGDPRADAVAALLSPTR